MPPQPQPPLWPQWPPRHWTVCTVGVEASRSACEVPRGTAAAGAAAVTVVPTTRAAESIRVIGVMASSTTLLAPAIPENGASVVEFPTRNRRFCDQVALRFLERRSAHGGERPLIGNAPINR